MAKKKTLEECIELSKELHGDIFDYSLFKEEGYLNNKTPVSLICKIHKHTFKVLMNDHLGKKLSGCSLCGLSKRTGRCVKRSFENVVAEGSGFSYKDALLMAATVGQIYVQSSKSWKTKLQRICTLNGYTVVGGITKLFKHIQNLFGSVSYQITLSSGGSSLKAAGSFKLLTPRYFWVDPNTLNYYHRNTCQKSILEKTFGQPVLDTDTESSYMERLGYLRVYDNGLAELNIG